MMLLSRNLLRSFLILVLEAISGLMKNSLCVQLEHKQQSPGKSTTKAHTYTGNLPQTTQDPSMRPTMARPPPELPPKLNNTTDREQHHVDTKKQKENHKEIMTTQKQKPEQSRNKKLTRKGWN
eukprot:10184289-Ditylum_brightwellii.AAC.1